MAPNAFVDDDDDTDRSGRRRSAASPANRAAPSVRRADTVTGALIEAARQLEEERALEPRLLEDRLWRREEAVVGNFEVAGARAAVDPHAGAEVDAQQPPERLEAIEDADMEGAAKLREREAEPSSLERRRRKRM